ncbi:Hypothetical protein MexAM1_META2p0283 (plasmid) [Methylorubrum extorquens AM1]|uniref:Uncharacterized protein n=1 Tax=Methylorubrum extorquens (strain ATCC 14718 / DSM 1338 / JCM 2805 / NCIMB 9133 / AM1) TaxID=272630 RepID=C5B3Y2_METEA|nr:Hypothetical protein MexAM1_META2p0283 [Methylorubrum extorquens AM1]
MRSSHPMELDLGEHNEVLGTPKGI